MPTSFAFRTVALVAIFAFLAGVLAAVANAQAPATTAQRTLVAVGTASIPVKPKDANSNESIKKAVEDATTSALPAAITDARKQATELAGAAGVTLGALLSVSNAAAPLTGGIIYGPYYPSGGSFGPNKFCGTVKTRSSTVDKNGKRHLGKLKARRVCRVPPYVQRTVQLTYALA